MRFALVFWYRACAGRSLSWNARRAQQRFSARL